MLLYRILSGGGPNKNHCVAYVDFIILVLAAEAETEEAQIDGVKEASCRSNSVIYCATMILNYHNILRISRSFDIPATDQSHYSSWLSSSDVRV